MVPTSYTGDAIVEQGNLAAGDTNVFAPASRHFIRSGLFAGDFSQTLLSLQNEGAVLLSGGTAGNVMTVTGNYVGAGGAVALDTALGGDASPTDLLVIQGDSLGSSKLQIRNAGGSGAQTNNGIKVIDVTGVSTGTFSLLGDYVHQGQQAEVGGAYAYKLYQGGKTTPGDGDWYLQSELITPTSVGPPLSDRRSHL
jgi:fibronectin-binding autotransporter adhesin